MTESLITKVIWEIVKFSTEKALKTLKREEKVLRILNAFNLKSSKPKSDFKSVYAHTLVEYGIEKPKPILEFFRLPEIQEAFEEAFYQNNFTILIHKAASLTQWHMVGDKLRELNFDPRFEFDKFTIVFDTMVDFTLTPAQKRSDNKLDEILEIVRGDNKGKIQEKIIEISRGSHSKQLKSWFKAPYTSYSYSAS